MYTTRLGPESAKAYKRRFDLQQSFAVKYMSGKGLDVGYKGSNDSEPWPDCDGIDIGDDGYDGIHLPHDSKTFDFVHSSHCLEHIPDDTLNTVIQEWFRAIKIGGFLIITVPHKHLYERKEELPSRWNAGHKRFYTPASLMVEIESALTENTYRVRHLKDCDKGHDYDIGDDKHAPGEYEIELVLERIK